MPILRRAYLIGAPVWAAMLPAATYAATRVHASAGTHAFALVVYTAGALVCHQKPERSFHLWAAHLPVCARCTGIYLGAAIAALASVAQPFRAATTAGLKAYATDAARARVLLFASAVPTIATLVFEWTTGITPSNPVRFAAGLPLGAVVSWLVLQVN
jgi:uncharacterized membrane protein